MRKLNIILCPFWKGQQRIGVSKSPRIISNSLYSISKNIKNINLNDLDNKHKQINQIKEFCIKEKYTKQNPTLFIGGDHTISLSSVYSVSSKIDDLHLLWIDAHADVNSPKTTMTGNMHGMPVYYLTEELKCIKKENLTYLGLRCVDEEEKEWIKENNIDAYYMKDIHKTPDIIFNKVFNKIGKKKVHISFDIDVMDPYYAPGTGTPVENGMNLSQLNLLIHFLRNLSIVSMDMVEVNLDKDINNKTLELSKNIIKKILI